MSVEHAAPLSTARAEGLAADAVDAARRAGADAADAVVVAGRTMSATVRNGTVEEAEQAEAIELGLRVFVGARPALVTLPGPAGLAQAAERAVAMARAAPEDETQAIAPAELVASGPHPDLDIHDATAPSMDELVERARAIESVMRAVPGVTNSGGVSASAAHAARAMATTAGFAGSYLTSSHGHGATAIAGDGTRMERDYWFASGRHLSDLEDGASVGRRAGERAVRRLDAAPVTTRTATVVFEPRAATGFVRHLLSAINGSAVARGATFLAGKRGERVAPEGITVRDDPLIVRGQASRPFDGEGLANAPMDVVADGILGEYVLDLQSARKLGLPSNARAYRGTGAPAPSPTNVKVLGGRGDLDSVIASAGQCLLVTDLIGMGANIVNGNYSRGASGFWYEGGELVGPVNEITVAGTLSDMFARAVFGDDAPGLYAVDAPTIAIEGMTIGGR